MNKYYCKNPFSKNCSHESGPQRYNTNCPVEFYTEHQGFDSEEDCLKRCDINHGNCDNSGRPYDNLFEQSDESFQSIIDNSIIKMNKIYNIIMTIDESDYERLDMLLNLRNASKRGLIKEFKINMNNLLKYTTLNKQYYYDISKDLNTVRVGPGQKDRLSLRIQYKNIINKFISLYDNYIRDGLEEDEEEHWDRSHRIQYLLEFIEGEAEDIKHFDKLDLEIILDICISLFQDRNNNINVKIDDDDHFGEMAPSRYLDYFIFFMLDNKIDIDLIIKIVKNAYLNRYQISDQLIINIIKKKHIKTIDKNKILIAICNNINPESLPNILRVYIANMDINNETKKFVSFLLHNKKINQYEKIDLGWRWTLEFPEIMD